MAARVELETHEEGIKLGMLSLAMQGLWRRHVDLIGDATGGFWAA